jgi:hypothetical protein
MPEMRDGTGAGLILRTEIEEDHLYLPNAPGN